MSARKSVWLDVISWMQGMDSRLPSNWPAELPPESSPDFWFHVAKIEMSTRDAITQQVRLLLAGEAPSMSALEAWLFRRRVEWAAQVALVKAQQRVESAEPLNNVLEWLLVGSWESDGCIGLWNHAERGGKPHPNNPDGRTPI